MPQYFIKSNEIEDNIYYIKGDDFHHLVNVRRINNSDSVILRDENGTAFVSEVLSITSESIKVKILETKESLNRSAKLHLYLSILKGKKFDLAIQKAVEVGVDKIVPIITERTVPDLKGKSKLDRWEKIVFEASKQSMRTSLPEIVEYEKIEDCFAFAKGLKILGQPDGEKKLYQVLRNFDESEIVSLFVGPEGGFSDREIEVAKKNGCEIVVFGENHLRAETAAIVLPALIQYERGLM